MGRILLFIAALALFAVWVSKFLILIVVGLCVWGIVHEVKISRVGRRPRPPAIHGPPRRKPAKRVQPVVTSPGYLRKWTPTRQWNVAQDKKLWDSAFLSDEPKPQPQPRPQPKPPAPEGADVYARLRTKLDQL